MSDPNGQGKSRLDRIEEILEHHSTMMISIDTSIERHGTMMVSIDASIERHNTVLDRIDALIERQIRANEAAHERFEADDKRLLTAQVLMNSAMQKMADGMISLELKMEETTEKLNALVATVDGITARSPSDSASA